MSARGTRALVGAAMIVLAAAGMGCLQEITPEQDDAGSPGTDAGDAGTSPGDAGADPDGGSDTDAGMQSDGGSTDAGMQSDGGTVTAPLTWGKMSAPAITHHVRAVAGTSKSNVYATGALGAIYRFDGTSWTKLTQSPSNLDLRSLYVAPDGAVFAVGGGQLVHCLSGCTSAGAFTWQTVNADLSGVCGKDSSTVYATGIGGSARSSNAGVLYQFQPGSGTWTKLTGDTGSYFNGGCWVSESGAVFMSAQASVVRFENSTFVAETVNYPESWTVSERAQQIYEAVWGSGSVVLAAGHRRGIISRNASGTWDMVAQPDGIDDYHALAGTSPTDAVVGGTESGDGRYFRVFDGTSWSTPSSRPTLDVWGLTAVDAKTYFAVGSTTGIDGVVWIGTRP